MHAIRHYATDLSPINCSASMNRRILWLLIGALIAGPSAAQCLKYWPDVVTLTGVVKLRTFYGPPGYGEDPAHDSRETQALLALDRSLCVLRGHDDEGLDVPESGQKFVTLVPGREVGFDEYRGKHISVRGTLFHAISGHHHTPILIVVVANSDIVLLTR